MRHCVANLFSFKGHFYFRVKDSKNPVAAMNGSHAKLSAEAQIRGLEVGRQSRENLERFWG